jgi:hypothetical protein
MSELLEKAIAQVRQLPESEQNGIAAMILRELEAKKPEFWDDFDQILDYCQVSTGISDLSYQHDRYVHGTPKRDLES